MRFTASVFTSALLFCLHQAASLASDSSATSAAPGVDVSSIPTCFLNCSGEVALSLQCKGATDLTCVCTKQSFVNLTGECVFEKCSDLTKNVTALQSDFDLFASTCKGADSGFNLTIPTAAQIQAQVAQLSNATNATTTKTTTNSNGTTISTSSGSALKSSAASSTIAPGIAHLVSATLILSVLAGGSLLLV